MKGALRRLLLATLQDLALERVIPERVGVRDGVLEIDDEHIDLKGFKKIVLVAIGKAAFPMARSMQRLIDPLVASGVVVSPEPAPSQLPYMLHYRGGHPYPTAESQYAAQVILTLVGQLHQHHLIIYLLSGGGSAIVEKPIDPSITLHDLREFYRVLVTCGAGIVEMNVLRKHFSATKGGRLAEAGQGARQVTLYVSDVPPDRPSTVASGPTMPDESTLDDCRAILERLGIRERLPASCRALLDSGSLPETPKPSSPAFKRSSWHALLSIIEGLDRLEASARAEGWVVERDLSVDDWPLDPAADHLLGRLEKLRAQHPGRVVAVSTGGELSSPVTGDGLGGRNQAFVLACAARIAGKNVALISAGTDGIDGNSPAAGAVADGETIARARAAGLEPAQHFARSDSYGFFSQLGDTLVTGATGNNIRDLRLLVAW